MIVFMCHICVTFENLVSTKAPHTQQVTRPFESMLQLLGAAKSGLMNIDNILKFSAERLICLMVVNSFGHDPPGGRLNVFFS